jgi:serine/threonine protein phosphatase 1
MKNEKLFIVGDIHGCLDALENLMKKIDWHPDRDGLIFLGDYVDRGRDPKGVIDLLIELSKESPHVRFLMGNHEALFLEYLDGGDADLYLYNGGASTLRSYGKNKGIAVPKEHLSFLQSLEPYIELDDYWIVHAGLQPGIEIQEQSLQDLLWIREPFIMSDYDFGKTVIFGHTPFSVPFIMENKIGLDTGAVFGNRLTCFELPARKFHSVNA